MEIPSVGSLSSEQAQEVLRLANIIYFRQRVYENTRWMGIPTAKCPMDMWVYQELLFQHKPDLLIETGTLLGGATLFFAQMFDLIGNGSVLSIDIKHEDERPQHPRIKYLLGSSVSNEVIREVENATRDAATVMVILDSDHKAPHKLKELELYGQFVTPGCYMIAEDTCFDYYPTWPEYGPGPATAVNQFLQGNDQFKPERSNERHLISFAPVGFLRRNTE